MFISPVRSLRVMAHAEAVTHSCESPLLLQEPRGPFLAILRGSSSCVSGPQDLCICQQFFRLPSLSVRQLCLARGTCTTALMTAAVRLRAVARNQVPAAQRPLSLEEEMTRRLLEAPQC